MNPDLQNKIDEDYIHGKNMVDEYGLSHEAIKSAKRTCWGSNTEMQVFAIGCEHGMQIERIKLQKELSSSTEKYDHAMIELRSYEQILDEKNKEIQSLKDENGRIREALGLFEKELKIGSDGTNLKCTCSRENCHSLWLSAGDIIYRVSYAHTEKFKALTQKAEE